MIKRAFALLLLLPLLAGCGARLDHFMREPSFSHVSRQPDMPPRNPAYENHKERFPTPIVSPVNPHLAPLAGSGGAAAAGYVPIQPAALRVAQPVYAAVDTGNRGSLWRSDPRSLFGDRRARAAGDILTVLIDIDDKADLSNATSRQRAGEESLEASAVFGFEGLAAKILPGDNGLNPGLATNSSSTANGQGQVSRNEKISLKIAARVLEVLPNGQLVITGRQEVRVNYELRDLQIVGIIRPEDISRNNEISYDRMAEARISYGGRGHISDVQQARYGQQALDRVSPF